MKSAKFDLEADGYLEQCTKVHILRARVGSKKYRWVGNNIQKGLNFLDTCDEIVAHNGIAFDLMVLWKLHKWRPKARIVDTLTLSQLIAPDLFGGHSLEAWGKRLGNEKIDYCEAYTEWRKSNDPTYKYTKGDEWLEYNPIMDGYCEQDVDVLYDLYERLTNDMKDWDWHLSSKMEHQFAKDFAVQAWRGVMVDRSHTEDLFNQINQEMEELEQLIEPKLPLRQGNLGELKTARPPKLQFKKDGSPSANALKWFDEVKQEQPTPSKGVQPYWIGKKFGEWYRLPTPMDSDDPQQRAPLTDQFPMQLKDQAALKSWLMDMGWVPTMWNYKKKPDKNGKMRIVRGDDGQPVPSQPKFHDKGELCPNLEHINTEFEHVKQVVRWVILRHRRGLVGSILEAIRDDGSVPATGMALGTPTSRVTHKVVANIPKADDDVVLGKECRSMFVARPGRVMVGVDASGLELRCLVHYSKSQALQDTILKGKKPDDPGYEGIDEIHTLLWKACHPLVPSRTIQKNVTYGWLYGASDKKLGQTAGHGDGSAQRVGAEIRKRMIAAVPGLEELMKSIEKASKRGYLEALDGRRIEIRSSHATLNTLLQSCGSILVKWAQCYMNAKIRELRLDAWQVISYHDEVQLDAHPKHAQQAGDLFIEGLQWAGQKLGFSCPLDGEVKIGNSWAETH